jgi:hypothetical protein
MLKPVLAAVCLLALSACTSFDPGLVDANTAHEPLDRHLEGVWKAEREKGTSYIKAALDFDNGQVILTVADRGRCNRLETYLARPINLDGKHFMQVRQEKEKVWHLGIYQWADPNTILILTPDDEQFAGAVEQGVLSGSTQHSANGVSAVVTSSPPVVKDYILKHPDAFKPAYTLLRADKFPC